MNLATTLILLQATASAQYVRLGLKASVSDAAPPQSEDMPSEDTGAGEGRVVLLYGEPSPTDDNRTEAVAKMIAAEAGMDFTFFTKPYTDYDFAEYDSIIVGAPTYNTGSMNYRSMTDWDDFIYDELPDIDVSDKKVAIFGTGKGWYPKSGKCCSGYGDNFGDAMGELYDRFAEAGAQMYGFTPENNDLENGGYNYTMSKFVRNGQFMGKMFDQKSQSDLSPGRAAEWVQQLKDEGFFLNDVQKKMRGAK